MILYDNSMLCLTVPHVFQAQIEAPESRNPIHTSQYEKPLLALLLGLVQGQQGLILDQPNMQSEKSKHLV